MGKKIKILDTTLRDGAQAQGISFSVEDKIKIVKALDEFGISYIEAGNPSSNPKDIEFFKRIKDLKLKNSVLTSFGSTRRPNMDVGSDAGIRSLLAAETGAVTIFGKSWDFHVENVLKTSLAENLNMIHDTIKFFRECGKEVIYDAEVFFEGYRDNKDYALKTLDAAMKAGADSICLCETTGYAFPDEIFEVTSEIVKRYGVEIGIHCHNDSGMAVAGTIMAVKAGATQVQGTFNGVGERCGNANLSIILPNLQLKMGCECILPEKMRTLTQVSRYMSEIANLAYDERIPYTGSCAFAHKAGMHADAINKNPKTFEHVDPGEVGNERVFLMSEVAGRSAVLGMINRVDPEITKDSPQTRLILEKLKEMEYLGYQYEGAESSFELMIRKVLGKYKEYFDLKEFKVIVSEPSINGGNSAAMIKIGVDSETEITAAEGNGPVNALDKAARKALERFYPQIRDIKLTDYKVRVIDSNSATAAKVRVLIESTDGKDVWTTIGVSADIIAASWKALVDSMEYKLMKDMRQ